MVGGLTIYIYIILYICVFSLYIACFAGMETRLFQATEVLWNRRARHLERADESETRTELEASCACGPIKQKTVGVHGVVIFTQQCCKKRCVSQCLIQTKSC